MKRIITVLTLICLAPTLVVAQDVKKANMLEFGIYGPSKQERIPDPGAPGGYILKGFTETLVSETNRVPATVGTKFGFRYVLEPNAGAKHAQLTIVYSFPEMTNPESGESFTHHVGHVQYTFGAPATYVIYDLEEDWEAIPGRWVLQIWEGKTKLLEKEFELVKAGSTATDSTLSTEGTPWDLRSDLYFLWIPISSNPLCSIFMA